MFSYGNAILAIIFVFSISLGIFLVIRFILLWYWRINEIVENQQQQLNALLRIEGEIRRANDVASTIEKKQS